MRGSGSVRGGVILSGSFTLTTAGALLSSDGFIGKVATVAGGLGVIATAGKTGRFSMVLDRKYKKLRPCGAPSLTGPTDSSFGNTTANGAAFRNVSGSGFDVQLLLGSTGADTAGATGTVVCWSVFVEEL